MKRLLVLAIAIAMVAFFSATVHVRAAQPHMQAALEHLQAAKAELQAAEKDKGGHREAALKATEEAIHHVHEGIEVGRHH